MSFTAASLSARSKHPHWALLHALMLANSEKGHWVSFSHALLSKFKATSTRAPFSQAPMPWRLLRLRSHSECNTGPRSHCIAKLFLTGSKIGICRRTTEHTLARGAYSCSTKVTESYARSVGTAALAHLHTLAPLLSLSSGADHVGQESQLRLPPQQALLAGAESCTQLLLPLLLLSLLQLLRLQWQRLLLAAAAEAAESQL
jgi:hypothetical protein